MNNAKKPPGNEPNFDLHRHLFRISGIDFTQNDGLNVLTVQTILSEENLCAQLEEYLQEKEWRKADEETAWIFYLVMVQQGYKNWFELCLNFPSEPLNYIDQLWLDNSKQKFGFSIQKRIWSNFIESDSYESRNKFTEFRKEVGWLWSDDVVRTTWGEHRLYAVLLCHDLVLGQLPLIVFTRGDGYKYSEGWFKNRWEVEPGGRPEEWNFALFSRINS